MQKKLDKLFKHYRNSLLYLKGEHTMAEFAAKLYEACGYRLAHDPCAKLTVLALGEIRRNVLKEIANEKESQDSILVNGDNNGGRDRVCENAKSELLRKEFDKNTKGSDITDGEGCNLYLFKEGQNETESTVTANRFKTECTKVSEIESCQDLIRTNIGDNSYGYIPNFRRRETLQVEISESCTIYNRDGTSDAGSEQDKSISTDKGDNRIISSDEHSTKRDGIGREIPEITSSFVPKYPDQKVDLITDQCNQPQAARELWSMIEKSYPAFMLIAEPGIGKTYIIGAIVKNFIEQGLIEKSGTHAPWPVFYITRATIKAQTEGVLKDGFNLDTTNTVNVYNIEFLRSMLGTTFVKEQLVIKEGIEELKFKWKLNIHPVLVIWDECQALARDISIQTQIAISLSELGYTEGNIRVTQVFVSATPFSKISETKCFSIATKKSWDHYGQMKMITEDTWNNFASDMSYPFEPDQYSEEAIKNYMAFMSDRIVEVKDIKLKHKSYISSQKISFQSDVEREEYQKAFDRWEEMKAKLESDDTIDTATKRFSILAQFTIFRRAAEVAKRYHTADFIDLCWDRGFAAGAGFAFKAGISAVTRILIEERGWARKDISLIWGGATEALTKRAKLLNKLKSKGLDKVLAGMNISLEDLDLDNIRQKTEDEYAFEKRHGLLTQKPEDREAERLRFQRQESKCLLFSYKAGGVGLSAHHEKQYPNSRPRRGIFTPIYSEKEMLQAFGRLPRITSESDTYQLVTYYEGTIEVDVIKRLIMKLKCARHVGRKTDSWEDIVTGRSRTIEEMALEEGGDEDVFVSETNAKLLEYMDEGAIII